MRDASLPDFAEHGEERVRLPASLLALILRVSPPFLCFSENNASNRRREFRRHCKARNERALEGNRAVDHARASGPFRDGLGVRGAPLYNLVRSRARPSCPCVLTLTSLQQIAEKPWLS